MLAPVRTTVARWLESGSLSTPLVRTIARAHATFAARAIARPVRVPLRDPRIMTVAVGGATLGGSGKTRIAIACARELAGRGANVLLVGHGYRAAISRARVVGPDDSLEDVGDEALICARELAATTTARVILGPTRQAAIDLAASLAPRVDAIVFDGPLQLTPVRASLALLALDARAPWGAGDLPPAGDLRAPREALLAAADRVVDVDATPRAATLDGRSVELAELAAAARGGRLGLFTAIARPERLERALAEAGLVPEIVVRAADHGPITPRLAQELASARADLWLATAKCALHLEAVDPGMRVAVLDGGVTLPPAVLLALRAAWETGAHGLP